MIERRDALGLALCTTLALVGPVALSRSLSPARWVAAQGDAAVWFGLLFPVAVVVVSATGARLANAAGGTTGRAISVAAGVVLAIAFLGGWAAPDGNAALAVVGLVVKVVVADRLVGVVRRALAERPYANALGRRLMPAAVMQAAGVALSVPLALTLRTQMGQGILIGATEEGLWIGPLGIAAFTTLGLVVAGAAWVVQPRVEESAEATKAESSGFVAWVVAGLSVVVFALAASLQFERFVLASADVAPIAASAAALLLLVAVVAVAAPDHEEDEG